MSLVVHYLNKKVYKHATTLAIVIASALSWPPVSLELASLSLRKTALNGALMRVREGLQS